MMENFLPFPSNRFAPANLAELQQWGPMAFKLGRYVIPRPAGAIVGRCDDGDEWIAVTRDHPDEDALFLVYPRRGVWVVEGTRAHLPGGSFPTLWEALQFICPTDLIAVAA